MVLLLAPAPHHDILSVLVTFTVLLVAARGLGEVAIRLKQPAVVGEILAGVILGPSLLARVPALSSWLVPESRTAGELLELIGLIGAMFLLLITGLETDIPLIRRHARKATAIASGGLVLPFAGGLLAATLIPTDLLGDPDERLVFSLFLATALAVSAIPVVAKVLLDLGLIRRTFGQTVLAAGMIDDTVAWIMLSVVVAMASGDATSPVGVALAAGSILLFIAFSATFGRALINRALAVVQDKGRSADRVLTLVVVATFGLGALAQSLGIEALLGAFIAGIILGQNPRLPIETVRRLHTMALAVFAPVFFAIAGLKVRIGDLVEPRLMVVTFLVLVVAVCGKVIGAYVGARAVGIDRTTALAYGAALDARGAVGIIIGSIGLAMGVLSPELYSVIVVVAVFTSLIAPPMVRWLMARAPTDPEEERMLAAGAMPMPRRVLAPVRLRQAVSPGHRVAADLLDRMAVSASVTLLTVTNRARKTEAERFLSELAGAFRRRPTTRIAISDDPVQSILETAQADYDLLLLGAPEERSEGSVFDPAVDDLARLAPCSTLIVTGHDLDRVSWPPQRILFPTNGTAATRSAARLAFALADGGELIAFNVIWESAHARVGAPEPTQERRRAQAQEIVDAVAAQGAAHGVTVRTEVRRSADVAAAILGMADEARADLIMLATDLRPGSSRLHLGPRVERIIEEAPCPVVLFNTV